MKIYFIICCLVASSGLANAAIQTTTSQDKPPRLYVKSYSENSTTSITVIDSPVGEDDISLNNTVNWVDGSAGNATWHYQFSRQWHDPVVSFIDTDHVAVSWPQAYWPAVSDAIWYDAMTSVGPDWNSSLNYTNITTNSAPILIEHCDLSVPIYDGSCTFDGGAGSESYSGSRTAQTIMKLQTGGKATSKLRNLFGITGSATKIEPLSQPDANESYYDPLPGMPDDGNYAYHGEYWPGLKTTNVPSQNICIGSYGNLNANGTKYLILPDNADVDVTPNVSGVDYYTFNVGVSQKYHSYFDVYVLEADPGGLLPYSITNDVGHAWYGLRTDAPTDALNYLHPTNQWFLSQGTAGYYPSNGIFSPIDCPGYLDVPESQKSYTVKRTFYIGFNNLIDALEFTDGLRANPGTYTLTGHNCVQAVRDAASAAGGSTISIIGGPSPQYFGIALSFMYSTNISSTFILP